MNIQPSVILWTVICFLLLMIVLKNLLFDPVLKILDGRKKQLFAARQKKADREKMLEEQARRCEALRLEREQKRSDLIKDAVEQIQLREKTALADAHRECLLRIDDYREQREKELEEILCAVKPQMAQVAELFVERITLNKE